VVISEIVDNTLPGTAVPPSVVDDAPAAPPKRSSRLASKESQLYDPVAVRAIKIRGLKDALEGCTSGLQKQVKKHGVLAAYARPLRKRAIKALTSSICVSSVPAGSDD
jgi:hypothetical protein